MPLTAIVALAHKKRTYFGADSAITDDAGGVYTLKDPKVRRSGGYAYGCSGETLFADLFDAVKFPAQPDDGWVRKQLPALLRAELTRRGAELPDGEAVVGAGGLIWVVEEKLVVHAPRDRWAATGSGMWAALGALHATPKLEPRKRLALALSAAARYDQAVRPPFRYVEA